MLKNSYVTQYNQDFTTYEFESIGVKGVIKKRIEYTLLQLEDYYNLGFGDINITTNEIDDKVVTNNGDGEKVLITVAKTLNTFFHHYPNAFVFATGSTNARTRLYRIGITNNYEEASGYFHIYGLKDDDWHSFEPNAEYVAFLITRKNK